jgi:cell division protein ZapA
MSTPTLDITLQGRAYSVACPPEEREALLEAVALLDAKMADIAKKTKSTGERLAVMAALNLAHELTSLKKSPASPLDTDALKRRIGAMEARLDSALAQQEDLF